MSDKVQLINEWVENLKNESPTIPDLGTNALAGFQLACDDVIAFIDSLPEEPKKQPKFKVGDTIKGPCNNIFQVKEVLDRQYVLHSENGDELNSIEIVDKSSCISKEPVSEDFEKAAQEYSSNIPTQLEADIVWKRETEQHFKNGAEWMKKKYQESGCEIDFTTKNQNLEEAAEAFYDNCNMPKSSWWDEGILHKMSESKETFIAGAKWQKQQMMKNAVNATILDVDAQTIEFGLWPEKLLNIKEGDKVKIIIVKDEICTGKLD